MNPINAMGNNPISYNDPHGDAINLAAQVAIGAALGALSYTAGLLIQDGSLANFNLGNFAGAVASGAVGALVNPLMIGAGIGGFAGGFVTGAASSAAGSITSGLINGNATGRGILSSALYGGLTAGLIQGIGASINGRRFWDGATVDYQLIVEDAGLNHVMQDGKHNCTCATGEMAIKAQGGTNDQYDIRRWMGGNPQTNPLGDSDVILKINAKTGLIVDGVENGKLRHYISKGNFALDALSDGKSVIVTMPNEGAVAHSVSIKGAYLKTITKVNSKSYTNLAFKVYNPSSSKPYYMSNGHLNKNALTVFSLWK